MDSDDNESLPDDALSSLAESHVTSSTIPPRRLRKIDPAYQPGVRLPAPLDFPDYVTVFRARDNQLRVKYQGPVSLSMYKSHWTPAP